MFNIFYTVLTTSLAALWSGFENHISWHCFLLLYQLISSLSAKRDFGPVPAIFNILIASIYCLLEILLVSSLSGLLDNTTKSALIYSIIRIMIQYVSSYHPNTCFRFRFVRPRGTFANFSHIFAFQIYCIMYCIQSYIHIFLDTSILYVQSIL